MFNVAYDEHDLSNVVQTQILVSLFITIFVIHPHAYSNLSEKCYQKISPDTHATIFGSR